MVAGLAGAEFLTRSHNRVMKVLDLQCANLHTFEGWFASEEDFRSQLGRGLLACPVCNDAAVAKRLSAPRLNLGAAPAPVPEPVNPTQPAGGDRALQAQWLRMMRRVMASTEDVGQRFAEVARQMHYGETEERSIRGQTSPEEAEALLDEGIPVLPLLLPDALKEPLQ